MLLKRRDAQNQEQMKAAASKKGKAAKRKGASYERTIAKRIGSVWGVDLKRTPQSGGFAKTSTLTADFRGDIQLVDETKVLLAHFELKNHKKWSLPQWLRQAKDDCPKGRFPFVVFHQHDTSEDYVCMSLNDFLALVPAEYLVKERDNNESS